MLYGLLKFLAWLFNFLVSTVCHPDLSVLGRFVADTFWRRKILPSKKKNLALLYKSRAIFSYEICCINFCYRRLTCIMCLCKLRCNSFVISCFSVSVKKSFILIIRSFELFQQPIRRLIFYCIPKNIEISTYYFSLNLISYKTTGIKMVAIL